jgi:hypothetical protein
MLWYIYLAINMKKNENGVNVKETTSHRQVKTTLNKTSRVRVRSSTKWGTSHHIASSKWPRKIKKWINQWKQTISNNLNCIKKLKLYKKTRTNQWPTYSWLGRGAKYSLKHKDSCSYLVFSNCQVKLNRNVMSHCYIKQNIYPTV